MPRFVSDVNRLRGHKCSIGLTHGISALLLVLGYFLRGVKSDDLA
ncbi:MAG: hypothetical protein ACK40X_06670 [Armatimonadota bacterium]